MDNTIEKRVKEVVATQLCLLADDLRGEQRFEEDLGADSLDDVELTFALEGEFGIEISDEQAEKIKTVQQAIDFVTERAPA